MFCQKCGTQNEDVARFCANCGEALDLGGASSNQAGAATAAAPAGGEFYPAPEEKANNSKKLVTMAIAAVAAIIVVVLGFNIVKGILGGDKVNYEKHPIVYNKDDEVMVQLAGKANPEKAYSLGDTKDVSSVKVTDDGEYIFYGDDYEMTSGEYDLYYRKASDAKGSSAKEIESGVTSYEISPDGKMVVFTKGDSNKLYISNRKKSEQIDKDVHDYAIVGNGKYIIYTIAEEKKASSDDEYSYDDYNSGTTYELYVCKMSLNGEPEKIADGVTGDDTGTVNSCCYIPYDSETGNDTYKGVLYYKKDGDLYIKDGKKSEKVLSDVYSIAYLDGKWFASTVDEKTISEDKAFKVSKDEDGYETRELLPGIEYGDYDSEKGEYTYVKREYTIYTVNGKKAKALDGTFTEVYLYSQYAVNDEEYFVITKGGKLISIGELDEDAFVYTVSEDEKYVYLREDKDEEEGTYTLNSYKLTSKGLGTKKEIAKDVVDVEGAFDDVIMVVTKDDEDSILNVYYKNKYYANIGENVESCSSGACEKTLYFLDDSENGEGTLMRYTLGKKEAVKIDDDVRDVEVRSDNMVYYIADWDDDDGCGTLFLAKGNGEPKVVDEEVSGIRW